MPIGKAIERGKEVGRSLRGHIRGEAPSASSPAAAPSSEDNPAWQPAPAEGEEAIESIGSPQVEPQPHELPVAPHPHAVVLPEEDGQPLPSAPPLPQFVQPQHGDPAGPPVAQPSASHTATSLLRKAKNETERLVSAALGRGADNPPSCSPAPQGRAELLQRLDDIKALALAKLDQLEGAVGDIRGQDGVQALAACAGEAKGRLVDEVQDLSRQVEALAVQIKHDIEAWAAEKKARLTQWVALLKEKLHLWVVERVEEMLDRGLDRFLPRLRQALKDPYMPRVVQRGVDRVVDSLWHDVKEEVIELVVGLIRPPLPPPDPPAELSCWQRFKAAVRYNLYPYDKSFWQNIRNPWFVLFRVACMAPVPGLLQLLWFFVLVCIDRGDEFQLLQYISEFKSMQFLKLGLLKVIIGTTMLYWCMTQRPANCEDVWEVQVYESLIVPCLLLQVVVVWGVFFLVPRAEQKGSYHVLLRADHERRDIEMEAGVYLASTAEARKGRQLARGEYPPLGHTTMWWLLYDMVLLVVCVILGICAMFVHENPKARIVGGDREGGIVTNWRFSATIFWLTALYGIGSFPFLLFEIPFISGVFTHAKPTGYNIHGQCVPFVGLPPEVAAERRRLLREEQALAQQQASERELTETHKHEAAFFTAEESVPEPAGHAQ